ncbi:hypothetical protein CXB51_008013 [Gossypium anomalum]|uniref:Uncharacterized protein n=1 Tax=Gossypium anomalum TaxID=47600 RepID=A0A8J5YV98_9ROSI|nr:hypothetical protein CXB51_008013 [Gossypium anomalum]
MQDCLIHIFGILGRQFLVRNLVKDMSTVPVRRVSRQDIQLVQNLIERCLQLYMTQKEVVETLLAQAKIEPGFTELVWQKLEEENREFFQAYYLRLMVKQQIMEFNKLLEQQVQLMHEIHPSGVSSISKLNGPHLSQRNTGKARKQESLQYLMGSSLPNVFSNSSSSLYSGTHASIELPTLASRIHAPSAMLSTQNSNMSLMQEINGKMLKSAAGFSGSSAYMFGAESSLLETRPTIGDTAFNSAEPSTQSLNEPLPDADISSFGLLGQISRNFNLSDLAADFSPRSGILESYPRSLFLGTDNENFLDSHEREHQGENKRLDNISEGLSFDGPTAALGKKRQKFTDDDWMSKVKGEDPLPLVLATEVPPSVVILYLESSHQNLFLVVVATEMALAPPPSTFDQLHDGFGTVFWTLFWHDLYQSCACR